MLMVIVMLTATCSACPGNDNVRPSHANVCNRSIDRRRVFMACPSCLLRRRLSFASSTWLSIETLRSVAFVAIVFASGNHYTTASGAWAAAAQPVLIGSSSHVTSLRARGSRIAMSALPCRWWRNLMAAAALRRPGLCQSPVLGRLKLA